MIYGYKPKGEVDLPAWADHLANLYWHIRVEGANKSKRRKYYRRVAKEKVRLAELYIPQELINVTCKYLANLKQSNGSKMVLLANKRPIQMQLKFD